VRGEFHSRDEWAEPRSRRRPKPRFCGCKSRSQRVSSFGYCALGEDPPSSLGELCGDVAVRGTDDVEEEVEVPPVENVDELASLSEPDRVREATSNRCGALVNAQSA
jgi:hypothetical protein